nr:hypothetical protein [Desulfuromonadales bacterium]
MIEDFAPRRLPATLAIGVAMALVNALLAIALISLIFSDRLADALPVGVGIALAASAMLGLIIAIMSGFPGMYSGIQDNSAAILGLASASIAASLVGPEAVDTVLAMIIATSLATGMVFIFMGTYRLGEIARFVPFPVIGGLLAGTGYLILEGSLGILEAGLSSDDWWTTDALGLLWPGLAFAGAFLVGSLRSWPAKVYLGFLMGGTAGFHLIIQLTGVGKAASLSRGWLLGPFPDGGLWPGFAADALTRADWGAIAG